VPSPTPAPGARQIAALANVLVIHGPGDPGLAAGELAGTGLAGSGLAGTGLAGDSLAGIALASDEFALVVKGPERQVLPRARFVPGRIP
jgi:hypothetical protein